MKTNIGVTIDKELYDKLIECAKQDKRSFSSLVNVLLWKALEQ